MADRDNRRSRVAAFASLPATRLGMLADSGNRQSQNVEDVTGATMLDKILASIPASAQGYAGDIAWLYRQGQLRPWRQTAGEHMQEAGNMLPDLDLRRNFAEGGTVDDILSAYSAPVRSWPGEGTWDRDAILPFARRDTPLPVTSPDQWGDSSDVMRSLDAKLGNRWQFGMPRALTDIGDAASAIHADSGTALTPMRRPSDYSPEEMDRLIAHGMAGALAGIAGNMPRVLAKPSASATELGIFGGRSAKTADQAMLAKAEAMAAEGAPREKIWSDTGWFQGVDGKWRFEIDDSQSKLFLPGGGEYRLMESLDSPVLDAYPTLWDIPIKREPRLNARGAGAAYFDSPERMLIARGSPLESVLHELQHAVQNREQFARGASMRDSTYVNQAGEVEARAVQSRMKLTGDQRRARPPWLDYDIPESQQIVRFGDKGPQMSMSDDASRPPLPMDEASRLARAREMGFDTDDLAYRGLSRPYDENSPGYYQMFTSSPAEASEYAMGNPLARPNVVPAYLRKGRNLEVDAQERNFNSIPTATLPQDIKAKLRGDYARTDEIAHAARELGYDSATIKNVFDNATNEKIVAPKVNPQMQAQRAAELDAILAELGVEDVAATASDATARGYKGVASHERGPVTINAIFDKKNIRSPRAAFDPSKKDSKNILASHHIPLPVPREDERIPSVDDILNLYAKD